jgi:hypothetical protein
MIVLYMLHLLLSAVFLYVKLTVIPHPVYGTSPSTQGIDSDPIGEAGFQYLHQAHFLEGLLCSATGSSKKLRPRGLRSDNENLDSDSDVRTTSLCKQLQSSVAVVTSDSETSDMWCKTDQKPNNEPFFGTTGLYIVTDNPESVVEVVRSVIGDDLIRLFTEQSNFYHSQNTGKWKDSEI